MTNIEKIQSAEENVARVQDAVALVQMGLERAEDAAVAADTAKRKLARLLPIMLGLIGLSILVIALSRRRRNREPEPTQSPASE